MLKIKYLNTDYLNPYKNNSRTHSEAQIKQISASIQEFGFTNPILIDEKGIIIAGHGRVMAAKALEIDEVPTILLDSLTKAQKAAYVIADNKLALNAGWSFDNLKLEIDHLIEIGFDLEILGFDESEFDEILKGWDTDIDLPEIKNSRMARITIECKEPDKHDVLIIVEEAVKESGIDGVVVGS